MILFGGVIETSLLACGMENGSITSCDGMLT